MSAGRARAPGPLRRLLRGEGQRRRRPPPSLFTTAPRDRNGAAAPLNGRADPALLRRASTDHPLEMGTRRGADAGAPACRGPSKGLVAAATAGSPTRIGPRYDLWERDVSNQLARRPITRSRAHSAYTSHKRQYGDIIEGVFVACMAVLSHWSSESCLRTYCKHTYARSKHVSNMFEACPTIILS